MTIDKPRPGLEDDRMPDPVACLNTRAMPATLVSSRGFNCEVWQSAGTIVRGDSRRSVNFVVKQHREPCSLHKVRAYRREYQVLKTALEELIPDAWFVATRVNGRPGAVVLAEACSPWFDVANPGNEGELRPLLERMPRVRGHLQRFVAAARRWGQEGRVVDLYGHENLVLDRAFNLRYLDSFGVFFYEDMLHVVAGEDELLRSRIDVSRRRLRYLENLLDEE